MGYGAASDLIDSDISLLAYAQQLCAERLAAYSAAPHDAEEHANIETSVLAGGYAYRQIAELVQNAADAIADGIADADQATSKGPGRIVVTADILGLWAANTGAAVDRAGVRALLNSNASGKRAGQIGRFGLGFKSLLRLGGRINVLSRSVCLNFDPERCRVKIRKHLALSETAPAPGLRLAEAGAWSHEIAALSGAARFDWATTIVFAELVSPGAREAVIDEIRKFPAEFLLFLPCDVELELRAGDVERRLRRRSELDGCVVIEDLASEKIPPQRWRVFQRSVRVTEPAALEDATAVHFRDTVPLIWAAPVGTVRDTAGRFYAFFPTTTETRTLGILNAPWKLNSDRTALIPGSWNAALMEAGAELIVDCLPELAKDEDPGAVLDAFPRELQTLSEPAAPLVNALWKRLVEAKVLPNCNGERVLPVNLHRAPQDMPELIAAWSRLADTEVCETYLHPSCTSSVARIGRLNQLAERVAPPADKPDHLPRLRRTPAIKWLELAASTDAEDAVEALLLADSFAKAVQGYFWDQIRDEARLILTNEGDLVTASEVILSDVAEPPLKSVHPELAADSNARRVLQTRFNILDGTETDWTRLIDAWIERAEKDGDWTNVWRMLRRMPWDDACEILESRSISVMTLEGWRASDETICLGDLITLEDIAACDPESQPQLRSILVDNEWHSADEALLAELNVRPSPPSMWSEIFGASTDDTAEAKWYRAWRERHVADYHSKLGGRPDRNLLGPAGVSMPAGWPLLVLAPPSARSRVTAHFLGQIAKASVAKFRPVTFKHSSRPTAWEARDYPHPLWNLLFERGELVRDGARLTFKALLVHGMLDLAKLLPSLSVHYEAFEALKRGGNGRISTLDKGKAWAEWLAFASREGVEPQVLAQFWSKAAAAGIAPELVCSPAGPVPISDVWVATSERDVELARQAGLIAVSLDLQTAALWIGAGAKSFERQAQLDWLPASEETSTIMLLDIEPALRDVLRPEIENAAAVTLTANLEQRVGDQRYSVDWASSGGQLFVRQDALTALSWPDRIRFLVAAATACGWVDGEDVLERVLISGVNARRRAVASERDLPARLLRAVGGARPLTALFEPDVQAMLASDPDKAASVALTLFGPALLSVRSIVEAMENEGLQPPQRWGTEAAADFVASIGFPPEYAASPAQRREAELAVSGPLPLKPLHDFQEEVVGSLTVMFADPASRRRRVVISLPTGAGKTRVAAETAVRQILSVESTNRLVLWVAQTDELCEQAVQCFRELWTNIGAPGEVLRIVRLWGGQINPQPAERGEPVVIVASIQTLSSRVNDPKLGWASRPGLIVIDECHHALTPSYTGMLRWLNSDTPLDEREPPIVGLSATPFRGRNEEESLQLARRFDGRLIPKGQSTLFDLLQSRGVLAKFGYTRLSIDKPFELSLDEQAHLERFQKLPDSALTRLGENQERNDRILDEIKVAKEQSALVFATSVAHAQRLAARLNVMGISAAAVSSETDRGSRRWFIRAFQRGDVRVLCNHSALTTGFDAPATDLIVIARPVFSPSLYMQMVGRGLRGPANGGKATCRILTVQDNLDQYTGKLAHHYFEQHYVQS